jgi:hypothetical protein
MKEMIIKYNRADQYVKLKGRQIDVGEEGMARIFYLFYKGIVPIGRENYNPIIEIYFIKDEHEHYIPCSSYLIAKANGKWKVVKLEALTKIMSFRQRNKFVPSVLISMMLPTEKEEMNWVVWFSHKLQNVIIAIQCKARKIRNTLAGLALTIIGHHYLKQWELEKEQSIRTKKKTQNKKEKMIMDVNAILLVEKKKNNNNNKSVVTTGKEIIKVSPV